MPEGNDDFWSDGAEPNGEDFGLPETQGDHNLSGYVEAPMVEEAADTTSFEAHDSARPLSCIPFEPFLLGDGPSGQTQEEPQTKAVHAPIEPPTIEPMDIGMRVEAPPDAPEAEWHVAGIEQPTSQDSEQSFSEVPVNLGTALPENFSDFNAAQKITWFNRNEVSEEDLLRNNVPPEEVAWMKENGYRGNFSPPPEDAPRVVVFGDSISSVVGYNTDSSADLSYGDSVADVLGNALGVQATSTAVGGETSSDSLNGTPIPYDGKLLELPHAPFEDYIKSAQPEVVVLRYGAADALRGKDPNESLANIEKMINISLKNGATPVLVGVAPIVPGGDSRAGNISLGWVDPYIPAGIAINEGIKKLADQYGLKFIDVRSLEVPPGALLDGVHPTGEFGHAMSLFIAKEMKNLDVFQQHASKQDVANTTPKSPPGKG